jgi:hypothetical protein
VVEEAAGQAIAEIDNWRREGEGDDGDEGLEGNEANGQKQCDVLADVQTREEGNMERHGGGSSEGEQQQQQWVVVGSRRDGAVMSTCNPSVDCNANASPLSSRRGLRNVEA